MLPDIQTTYVLTRLHPHGLVVCVAPPLWRRSKHERIYLKTRTRCAGHRAKSAPTCNHKHTTSDQMHQITRTPHTVAKATQPMLISHICSSHLHPAGRHQSHACMLRAVPLACRIHQHNIRTNIPTHYHTGPSHATRHPDHVRTYQTSPSWPFRTA